MISPPFFLVNEKKINLKQYIEMACNSIQGILKGCDDNNIGGILEVYIVDQASVSSTTLNTTGHTLTAIGTTEDFDVFQFNRNVGNFTTEETTDVLIGSTVFTGTINLVFNRREGSKSRALTILGEGQRYLAIIVKSANGTYTYFENMQLMSANENSGTARAEGSNYTVVFSDNGNTDHKPYFVDPSIIAALIS